MGLVDLASVKTSVDIVCSVCIANFNGAAILRDCIDSILAQEDADSTEIIVHDDASDDDSVALLAAEYPQVRLLRSETNVGFCIANNRMVSQARGEFVLLLNNDAALLPGALRALTDAACAHSASAVLTLPQYDWYSSQLVDRGCLLDPFHNPIANTDAARTEVAMVIGACLFLRRALWIDLGGFPEWMESIAEDLYLCCVARLRGHPVIALTKSGYRHRRGATFSGDRGNASGLYSTFRRRHLSERNKTAVLAACTPTLLMWPWLAVHVLVLAAEGFVLALLKRDASIWTRIYALALRETWSRRHMLASLRRDVQRSRRIGAIEYWRVFRLMPYKLSMAVRHGLPTLRR